MLTKTITLTVTMIAATAAAAAQDLPPLRDNDRVQKEFLSAAVGDEIRKNCPTMSARMFRVWTRARELEQYAISLGYTKDDIDAMRKDPDAKEWLKTQRDNYLEKNGVVSGDAESYCQLGRDEIERNSLTGWLLRAN
ncbi:DUF5333 domain-containing protein [Pseudoruegeria sp. HB172150]|uniref:DUF5333 domain-containing protein n=1 Tax=Pseudoruegeria sp. HB172150 TaxID=2721164 RepID=UPI001554363C|nr:DUF5333 domain-containing protein [Pseudoruegeria sp. HB172150]